MTEHTEEFNLAEIIQTCIQPNTNQEIHGSVVNANGVDLTVNMRIRTENSKVSFGVFFRPNTCTVYREIELCTQMGFLNANGNLCKVGKFERTYKYPDPDKRTWGRWFYEIPLTDIGKIERYYACGDKLKIQYRVLKCSVHPCLERVLRSIYMSSSAGEMDKMQRAYSDLEEANCEMIRTNDELHQKVDELQGLLDEALQAADEAVEQADRAEPRQIVSISRRSDTARPDSVPTLREQINRMEIAQLNELSEQIKERIIDLQRCKICLDERSDTLLMPCHHMCMCSACADIYPESTCPVCRGQITDKIRVYQS